MIPQFYINYKLQSTAHLPHWTLFLRFLASMIDNVFSLLNSGLTMPTVYRLACFRDEVVFLVYIVQLVKYPAHRHVKAEEGAGEDEGGVVTNRKSVGTGRAMRAWWV